MNERNQLLILPRGLRRFFGVLSVSTKLIYFCDHAPRVSLMKPGEGSFSAVRGKFLHSHMQNYVIKIHRPCNMTTESFMVLCHIHLNGGLTENRTRATIPH